LWHVPFIFIAMDLIHMTIIKGVCSHNLWIIVKM